MKGEEKKQQIEEFEDELDMQQINKAIENHARKFDNNKDQQSKKQESTQNRLQLTRLSNSVSLPKIHQKLTLKE